MRQRTEGRATQPSHRRLTGDAAGTALGPLVAEGARQKRTGSRLHACRSPDDVAGTAGSGPSRTPPNRGWLRRAYLPEHVVDRRGRAPMLAQQRPSSKCGEPQGPSWSSAAYTHQWPAMDIGGPDLRVPRRDHRADPRWALSSVMRRPATPQRADAPMLPVRRPRRVWRNRPFRYSLWRSYVL